MKKLIKNNPRGLTAAIAVLVCCTGAARATVEQKNGTNAIAFTEQRGDKSANLADAQQRQFNESTQYISPLTRALELKNELAAGAPTPNAVSENNTSYTKLTDKRSCFNGSLTYDVTNFSAGIPKKLPWAPSLDIKLAELTGKIDVTGRYCRNGKWDANGGGKLNCKVEAFYGISTGGWYKYAYGTRRFRVQFGIKGESNLSSSAEFRLSGSGWPYQYAMFRLGLGADLGISFLTPRLTVQKLNWNDVWVTIWDDGLFQGDYVDGAEFTFEAYGKGRIEGWYTWEVWDNDADKPQDSERHRVNATVSGDAGMKMKLKYNGRSSEINIRYSYAKELLNSSGKHAKYADKSTSTPVDDQTDHEVSRRP